MRIFCFIRVICVQRRDTDNTDHTDNPITRGDEGWGLDLASGLASGLAFRSGLVPERGCRSALDSDADFPSAWDSASPLASDSVRDSESVWE